MLRIAPIPAERRSRRLAQLLAGLTLYGVTDGLLLRTRLGVDPWDVLHQGLSRTIGLQVGTWTVIVGAAVLLLWIPLRQRPGLGTLLNVVLIGLVVNVTLAEVPPLSGLAVRIPVLVGAVVLNGIATGLYIGAGLGPGPRDGIMTGLARRGHSVRVVRTGIELVVLAGGWMLGGNVGVGTVFYALAIGPIVHLTLPALVCDRATSERSRHLWGGRRSGIGRREMEGCLPGRSRGGTSHGSHMHGRSIYDPDSVCLPTGGLYPKDVVIAGGEIDPDFESESDDSLHGGGHGSRLGAGE